LDQYYIAKARVIQAKNFEAAAPTNPALKSKNIFLRPEPRSAIIDLFDGQGIETQFYITNGYSNCVVIGV
jgi:hypothetical protein